MRLPLRSGSPALALARPPASVTAVSSDAEAVMVAKSLEPVMLTTMSCVAVPSDELTVSVSVTCWPAVKIGRASWRGGEVTARGVAVKVEGEERDGRGREV